MKTQFILVASMVLGLGFGASAQSKTGMDTTTNHNNSIVQPYGVEEESDTMIDSTEFNLNSPGMNTQEQDVMMEPETNTEGTLEGAASKTGSTIKSGASKVGNAAEKGGKKIYKGGKKAGKAVKSGAKEGWQETKQHTPGTDAREMHKEGKVD